MEVAGYAKKSVKMCCQTSYLKTATCISLKSVDLHDKYLEMTIKETKKKFFFSAKMRTFCLGWGGS